MKKLAGLGAVACFLALTVSLGGCTAKEEASSGKLKEEVASGKSKEESAIGKIITETAKAMTEFPRTKDKQSVLRFYAKDYVGVTDGELETLKEIEKHLSDLEEQINLASPIGISNQVTSIKAHVANSIGWATYDYVFKLGSGGAVLRNEQGKCTAIYRMESGAWLIQHEHCSTKDHLFFPGRR
jgi:ketosteroid isomerase-like protein